jgi:general stress protein 26
MGATARDRSDKEAAMDEPETKLDGRYSESGAVATSWAEALRELESAQLFWITTVRQDARPHVTPLVAVWMDDALHFSTGPEEQKALNLRSNPHVALTTGSNGWRSGLDVVLEGDAERVTDEERLERLAAAWARKWEGSWRFGVRDGCFVHPDGPGGVLVFSVRPTKVLAFGKGPFSHTRHVF